jgi:hypothetical protein
MLTTAMVGEINQRAEGVLWVCFCFVPVFWPTPDGHRHKQISLLHSYWWVLEVAYYENGTP